MKRVFMFCILFCVTFVAVLNLKMFYLILTTDPPPAYMVKNLEEQVGCAKKAGFVFEKPILRILKPPYKFGSPHGFAHMYLNIITIVTFASYETMAHELGHIIDYQTGRKGHPFFVGKENLDIEVFAYVVGDVILNQCRSVN